MAQREKRANAGNRMAKLLDEEEEDDFYKTTYGGFQETEEDKDYVEEKEADDIVDSDFDIDENDDPVSDQEIEEKRKRAVGTKAYKDPKKKKAAAPRKEVVKRVKEDKPEKSKSDKKDGDSEYLLNDSIGRKSIRKSTAVKSLETQQRIKIRSELKKKKPKKVEEKMPSQEELLEEALITEQENLKSLERFEQIELERKKVRPTKKAIVGPVIRYHSFAVPIESEEPDNLVTDITLSDIIKSEEGLITPCDIDMEEVPVVDTPKPEEAKPEMNPDTDSMPSLNPTKIEIDVIGPDDEFKIDDVVTEVKPKKAKAYVKPKLAYERTLLIFDNDLKDKAFKKCYRLNKPRRRQDMLCAVTKKPARYIDPITKLPYRSVDAFRIIREAYYQQLEARGDRNDPKLQAWLKWRRADSASTYVQIHIK
ncbi:vacuolar protein sorting-associated protein 72 homolog [Leguminivora glycinivorella]|uniref:vacuolar protein sorting-associated protein 72 homolog n=1 Tax=Leguminivora glycinivorella TaxID=1035111 RepID=UPI00200E9DCB|nr:vacuolar protein sorting-associated protein 72 homolog [Leguminivora glycinivorella]